uniref:Uncharacterized protein n=1 Tax=Glossina brevipalpis TaxID=37001 RepID=A0A1A9X2Y0_9MUSC
MRFYSEAYTSRKASEEEITANRKSKSTERKTEKINESILLGFYIVYFYALQLTVGMICVFYTILNKLPSYESTTKASNFASFSESHSFLLFTPLPAIRLSSSILAPNSMSEIFLQKRFQKKVETYFFKLKGFVFKYYEETKLSFLKQTMAQISIH